MTTAAGDEGQAQRWIGRNDIARVPGRWEEAAIRVVDILGVVLGLVVLLPLLMLVGVAIRFESPGPAIFRQIRVGTNGRTFELLKFRTMRVGGDDSTLRTIIERELRGEDTIVNGSSKPVDRRVTRIGRLLRSTSFDELPQLINVLRGEMSLVGPRPCLPWEAEMFPPEARARFGVRPGITGLWQIKGRSTLGTLEMLHLDVEYVRQRSFGRYIAILAMTIPSLLRGGGAR